MEDRPEAGVAVLEAQGEGRRPWDRQQDEPSKAFQAFTIYLNLGNKRTLLAVDDEVRKATAERRGGVPKPRKPGTKPAGSVSKWSRKYGWAIRVAAWGEEQERVKRQAQLEEVEEMARRHASVALLALSKAVERLQSLTDEDISTISPLAATKIMETAVKIERQARGMPGEIVQQDGKQKVTVQGAIQAKVKRMSTDNIAKLEELLGDDDCGVDQE